MREEPTLSDVASFAPTLTPLSPEPDGIGLAGLPLNVVAHAEAHTQTGELFDLPVTVRFRPVSFTFDYGDGTTRESATGGATWQQLGAAQFTATDTSHAYRQRGTYTITAVVHFAADVDFGNGWQRVPGLLGIPAGSTTVEILEARTALVERTCAENPSGIGC
ncbi:PKD domain-containing protein [Microbacterium sp. LjRoot45]|uniref:PKD domain-containing protein n=1 Tax=Microbacterium sp. LjRoot45 TaxID=3342329 RepID=UPI003F4FD189